MSTDDRPNIILFTTDQQRGDHIGLAGHPVVETPNLDSFVNHGAYFPNAYSELPSTTGARRCLHGGQGSYDCGYIGYGHGEWMLRETLAQVLADAGYHCINVGWRNMQPTRKLFGFHHVIPHDLRDGVDDYRDWLREQLGPQAEERSHGCDANGWLARPWNLPEHMHPTCWTTDVTLRQIEKRDPTRPVFVWCSHLRPHSPYDPPQFFWDQYIHRELPPVPVGDWADKHDVPIAHPDRWAWQGRLPDALAHRMRAAYMATCTHLDWELGRLMEGLARHRLIQNTCILYTADHGDMMGDHHLHRKTYAYEGSARIPMAIRYPAAFDGPCGTFDPVVGLQDVMPTLLEIAGVDVPPTVTGASMLGAARGGPWREFFHGEHSPCYSAAEAMQYLTDGREKYIYFPTTGEEQLFDLVADRQECHDLARDPSQADRVARWRQRLIDRLGRRGDGFSDGQRLLVRTDHYSAVVGKPPVEM